MPQAIDILDDSSKASQVFGNVRNRLLSRPVHDVTPLPVWTAAEGTEVPAALQFLAKAMDAPGSLDYRFDLEDDMDIDENNNTLEGGDEDLL